VSVHLADPDPRAIGWIRREVTIMIKKHLDVATDRSVGDFDAGGSGQDLDHRTPDEHSIVPA
jgi:hypothetical protein